MSVLINGNGTVLGVTGVIPSSASTFLPAGTGAVSTTVQAKLRQIVSVLDFGADPTGVVPCDTALANARAYIAGNATRYKLVFPSGIYSYSVSPNWAIQNVVIEAEGEVRLRYSGVGNAVILDAGTATLDLCYNVTMGRFIVECPSTGQNAVFVRSVHHSELSFDVHGAGTTYAGLRVEFAVCTDFPNFACTVNEENWYAGAKPQYGANLTVRNNNAETVSYCLFTNPIIEGPDTGINLVGTLGNVFIGGTSEACSTYGVFANSSASQDRFFGTDFEVNTVADIYTTGCLALEFIGIDTTNIINIGTGSNGVIIDGGLHQSILVDTGSVSTTLSNCKFNRFGSLPVPIVGTMTDAGTNTFANGVRDSTSGTIWLTGTASFTPGTIATLTAAQSSVTVPGAKLGDTVVVSFSLATTGLATTAFVQSANTVFFYMYNVTGGPITIGAGTVKAVVTRS
jgi:hypothetical protein